MAESPDEIDRLRSPPSWWSTFFDDEYAAYGLAAGDPAERAQRIDFLMRTLELERGDTVFDQCCGVGRLSLPLAERGVHIIGVDQAAGYVERATHDAAARGLDCEFHCADAHDFIAPRPCDAAVNWFTSFGYCEDDERTIHIFRRAFESLKPGGRAIFEYQNIPRIMRDFQNALVGRPGEVAESGGRAVPGMEGVIVVQENAPDFLRGMMTSRWSVLYPGGRRTEHRIETRLFMPHEIVRLLQRCGFTGLKLLGGHDGSTYTRDSIRLAVVCRKPAVVGQPAPAKDRS